MGVWLVINLIIVLLQVNYSQRSMMAFLEQHLFWSILANVCVRLPSWTWSTGVGMFTSSPLLISEHYQRVTSNMRSISLKGHSESGMPTNWSLLNGFSWTNTTCRMAPVNATFFPHTEYCRSTGHRQKLKPTVRTGVFLGDKKTENFTKISTTC